MLAIKKINTKYFFYTNGLVISNTIWHLFNKNKYTIYITNKLQSYK